MTTDSHRSGGRALLRAAIVVVALAAALAVPATSGAQEPARSDFICLDAAINGKPVEDMFLLGVMRISGADTRMCREHDLSTVRPPLPAATGMLPLRGNTRMYADTSVLGIAAAPFRGWARQGQYATGQAWAWSGDGWTSTSIPAASWVWAHPMSIGWHWVMPQGSRTWHAMRTSDLDGYCSTATTGATNCSISWLDRPGCV